MKATKHMTGYITTDSKGWSIEFEPVSQETWLEALEVLQFLFKDNDQEVERVGMYLVQDRLVLNVESKKATVSERLLTKN
jgi:hypothetical protein